MPAAGLPTAFQPPPQQSTAQHFLSTKNASCCPLSITTFSDYPSMHSRFVGRWHVEASNTNWRILAWRSRRSRSLKCNAVNTSIQGSGGGSDHVLWTVWYLRCKWRPLLRDSGIHNLKCIYPHRLSVPKMLWSEFVHTCSSKRNVIGN